MRGVIKILFPGLNGSNRPEVAGDIEYGNFGVCAARRTALASPFQTSTSSVESRADLCLFLVFSSRGDTLRGKFWITSILAAAIGAALLPQPSFAQPAPAPPSADSIQQSRDVLSNPRVGPEARNAAARKLVGMHSPQARQVI